MILLMIGHFGILSEYINEVACTVGSKLRIKEIRQPIAVRQDKTIAQHWLRLLKKSLMATSFTLGLDIARMWLRNNKVPFTMRVPAPSCEDTRRTKSLLQRFFLGNPLPRRCAESRPSSRFQRSSPTAEHPAAFGSRPASGADAGAYRDAKQAARPRRADSGNGLLGPM